MASARRTLLCRGAVALLSLVVCAGVAQPAAAETVARPHPVASAQTVPLIQPAPPGAPSGPAASREVVAWRTETSRTIEMPGRGYRTEISTAPLHRRDAAGRWQPLESGATPDAVTPIGSDKITDCHIVDGVYADSSFCNNDHLELGYPSTAAHDVHRRVLLKFDVAAIPQTAVVVDADVRLTTISADRSAIDFPVQALRLAQSWTTSATWNNSGTGTWSGGRWGPTLLDSRRLTSTLGSWHIFPTVQVQNWVDRSATNNGLILKPQNESTGVGVVRFASSTNADPAKRPLLSVDWRIQGGQKEVNTFVPQSLTDRCDLGTNVGTGTLLARCTEFRIAGVGQNLTISRYYNSTDERAALNNADATLGLNRWKLSTGVYLLYRSNQVLYVDGSGAIHPFHRNGSSALNTPAGLDATLEENQPATGQYRLKFHKSGEQYIFKKWNTDFFNWTYQLWKVIDRNQNTTEFSYTTRAGWAEGALAWVKDTRGRSITAGYTHDTASGKDFLTSLTDSAGRSTTYSYTGHALTAATDTDKKTTTYQYADFGSSLQQLSKIVDPRLKTTELGYDSGGRVIDINRHRTPTTTENTHVTYNDTVSPPTTVVRDPRLNSTIYEIQNRSSASRVTKVIDAKGKERSTSYTSNAKVGSITNQVGGVTTNTWGANPAISGDATSGASLTRTVGPMGDTTQYEYSSPTGTACPTGASATGDGYSPICARNSAGNKSTYTYDGPGNFNESKNQAGATAKVDRAVSGSGATPTDGRILRSTDPRGHVTTYNYSDVTFAGRTTKRLSSISAPAGSGLGTRTLTYDGLDRLRTFTTGRTTVVTLSYDGADRVTSVDYSDTTPDVGYVYDAAGNLTERSDATGVTTYTYDGKNQLTRKVTPQGTMTYDYDSAGNLISAGEDGQPTTYGYDTVNQVVSMTEPDGRTTRFAYRADGKRTDTWYNANATDPPTSWAAHTRVDFDSAGRLSRIKTTRASSDADGNRIADFSHCYRAFVDATTPCSTTRNETADRSQVQWAKNNLSGTVTFYGYDGGDRLQTAWPNDGTAAYTYRYDNAGNRDSLERNTAATVHYEYNSANQLCWSGPSAGTSCASPPAGSDTRYRYDAAGNQTESPQLSALAYNGSEQTTSTTVRGGSPTGYSYAGDNQVERTTVGGTTYRNGVLGVQSQTTTGQTTYFGRTPDGGLVSLRTPGGSFYYVFDGRGSVVGLVDAAGTHRASYSYGPFGEDPTATAHNGTLPANPYRFHGEYLDAATGNYKIGMRYYQPITGRWTQQDSIEVLGDPAAGNRYTYVGDDPINYRDPTGQHSCWIIDCDDVDDVVVENVEFVDYATDPDTWAGDDPAVDACEDWGGAGLLTGALTLNPVYALGGGIIGCYAAVDSYYDSQ